MYVHQIEKNETRQSFSESTARQSNNTQALDYAAIQRKVAQGHALRSQAMHDFASRLFTGTVGLFK